MAPLILEGKLDCVMYYVGYNVVMLLSLGKQEYLKVSLGKSLSYQTDTQVVDPDIS